MPAPLALSSRARQRRRRLAPIVIALCTMVLATLATSRTLAAQEIDVLSGRLSFIWGDPRDGGEPRYLVSIDGGDAGALRTFTIDARDRELLAAVQRLNGQLVELEVSAPARGSALRDAPANGALAVVRRVRSASGLTPTSTMPNASSLDVPTTNARASAVTAPQPWAVVTRPYTIAMCKFADVDSEPFSRDDLVRMYSTERGGAAAYFQEVSRGRLSIAGTQVFPWARLPKPRSAYLTPSGSALLDQLSIDCLGLVDPQVDFRQVGGVGMHFNSALDCCSWGGSTTIRFDGQVRNVPAMWNASWARSGVIWHEMGHSFGLPHSAGPYGAVYDSRWDVMSSAGGGVFFNDIFSSGGAHFMASQKDRLGLLSSENRVEVTGGSWSGLVAPHATGDNRAVQYVRVPLEGGAEGSYLTVEVRRRLGYDLALPGEGVLIGTVDPARAEPSQVTDVDGNGNPNDAGVIWRVGSRYVDSARRLSIAIDSSSAAGFWISVRRLENAGAAIARFERTGGSWELPLSRLVAIRDSVRVSAPGAWSVRRDALPSWLTLLRATGTASGWVVFEIRSVGLAPARQVATLSLEAPVGATPSTFRVEVGGVVDSPDYALLTRVGRRFALPRGVSQTPFDSLRLVLAGAWSGATWTATVGSRYFVFDAQTGLRLTQPLGTGSTTFRVVASAPSGSPIDTPLIDTLRFTVRGPSTIDLLVVDTLVLTNDAPPSMQVSAKRAASTVPIGGQVRDSVRVTLLNSVGTWSAFSRRADTRLVRRAGQSGEFLSWIRTPRAQGRSVDSIYVSATGVPQQLLVDTITGVDVPMRLQVTRPGVAGTATIGSSARFDSTDVLVLGLAGADVTWRASTGSSTIRLHNRDAFIATASGQSGNTLRWSRNTTGLAPGRYIDTILLTVEGAANSPLRVVDTTTIVAPEQTVGDIDNDGAVTAADGVALLRHLVQLPIAARAQPLRTGDVNCDGQVTVADALLLLQLDAGLETPIGCVGRPAGG